MEREPRRAPGSGDGAGEGLVYGEAEGGDQCLEASRAGLQEG